ncbi:MAG: C4-type zinc ribbon domain-containing protein [Actinomycetota bacterium]|nr:C4-type zinc ribbon domain-containing protein [Actinomycetota bacterium]
MSEVPAEPAPPDGPLQQLLHLQEDDTALAQLRHRLDTLPERGALASVGTRLRELEEQAVQLERRAGELAGAQAELERQIEAARARREQLDRQMRSGQVTAARDLTAMDEEVRHLAGRVASLEDRELEVMEEADPIHRQLREVAETARGLREESDRLHQALAAAEATLGDEMSSLERRRAEQAGEVPAALLSQYERIRAAGDGVGVARLVGSSCSGCHLTLPSMEVDRIRRAAPDAVVTCDQCGRILVR